MRSEEHGGAEVTEPVEPAPERAAGRWEDRPQTAADRVAARRRLDRLAEET